MISDRYYGHGKLHFSSFSILQCRNCRHEVWLEAHHREAGKPIRKSCPPGCRKRFDLHPGKGIGAKRIRFRHRHIPAPRKWDGICPVCRHDEGWKYIRTEVHLSAPVHAYR